MIEMKPQTLPHSEECERAVLSAILIDWERFLTRMSARLKPEDFYSEKHQLIFEAMRSVESDCMPVDIRTVQAKLEQRGRFNEAGGLAYIATLEIDLPDPSRAIHYAEIVLECSIRRQLLGALLKLYRACLDGGLSAREAVDRAFADLEEFRARLGKAPLKRRDSR